MSTVLQRYAKARIARDYLTPFTVQDQDTRAGDQQDPGPFAPQERPGPPANGSKGGRR